MTSIATPTANSTWMWRGHQINYRAAGSTGTAVLLIHGFGASVGHWRKNIPVLAEYCRCYAIDLIGFGASAKPQAGTDVEYTFETWGELVIDFCREVIGMPTVLIGNSIGCIVALQAAVTAPEVISGVALLNCSLRLLHDRKRTEMPWYRRWGTPVLQSILTIPAIGHFFFDRLAQRQVVRKILLQAYHRPEAVTDELIDILMAPAADPGAADVFLKFTAYSWGPLPEDLLPQLTCPAIAIWGAADPWEPIALGRELMNVPSIDEFFEIPAVGHCPQDEAPELVNPILTNWIASL
ncbi:alpha/beta fold hydrolase [Chamaesiphon minutus]|uniref:Putative hydrolase or acyltransferase of alpha/beta superfamily n=1 Tax=Chamaesiphon minutus (strain ATCC 27169 / PCC 6605) TaxID=1173020 RepID=K9ULY8_CHAP6|nr:alpha/beta fold hydrolase [Chamaesiphon minutus]AFY95810.1 putative hydrolase or acyltransferase of alpha/beta superfamily [Chamaesiphon minutus PCC 6605]